MKSKMENRLKDFLVSLPPDIQVALDELIQEGFEVDFYDDSEGHINIYLPKINFRNASWFTISTGNFCWYGDEGLVSIEAIEIIDLKPDIFKEKVKENLKWQLVR